MLNVRPLGFFASQELASRWQIIEKLAHFHAGALAWMAGDAKGSAEGFDQEDGRGHAAAIDVHRGPFACFSLTPAAA